LRAYITPFELITRLIPKGSNVLDIGCGTGSFLYLISVLRYPVSLTGIDILDTNLPGIYSKSGPVQYFKTGTPSSLKKNNFDVVSLIDVIHHINDDSRQEFILSVLDLIRPGGMLIVKEMSSSPKFYAWMNILHDLLMSGELIKHQEFEGLKSILIHREFTLSEVTKKKIYWYSHYWFTATKPVS